MLAPIPRLAPVTIMTLGNFAFGMLESVQDFLDSDFSSATLSARLGWSAFFWIFPAAFFGSSFTTYNRLGRLKASSARQCSSTAAGSASALLRTTYATTACPH